MRIVIASIPFLYFVIAAPIYIEDDVNVFAHQAQLGMFTNSGMSTTRSNPCNACVNIMTRDLIRAIACQESRNLHISVTPTFNHFMWCSPMSLLSFPMDRSEIRDICTYNLGKSYPQIKHHIEDSILKYTNITKWKVRHKRFRCTNLSCLETAKQLIKNIIDSGKMIGTTLRMSVQTGHTYCQETIDFKHSYHRINNHAVSIVGYTLDSVGELQNWILKDIHNAKFDNGALNAGLRKVKAGIGKCGLERFIWWIDPT